MIVSYYCNTSFAYGICTITSSLPENCPLEDDEKDRHVAESQRCKHPGCQGTVALAEIPLRFHMFAIPLSAPAPVSATPGSVGGRV